MESVVDEPWYKQGVQELKEKGVAYLTLEMAQQHYHNGVIGQDDYDLFLAVWEAYPWKFSVPWYRRERAIKNLKERYNA